jgi:hypothetical protein
VDQLLSHRTSFDPFDPSTSSGEPSSGERASGWRWLSLVVYVGNGRTMPLAGAQLRNFFLALPSWRQGVLRGFLLSATRMAPPAVPAFQHRDGTAAAVVEDLAALRALGARRFATFSLVKHRASAVWVTLNSRPGCGATVSMHGQLPLCDGQVCRYGRGMW